VSRVNGSGIYRLLQPVYFDTVDVCGNPYPSFHDTMHPDYTRRYVRVVIVYDICTIENTTRSTTYSGISR
jgi:hypothetical protein